VPKEDYFWKISYNSDSLYICHLNLPKKSAAPIIEVMDIAKKTVCRTTNELPGIKEILDRVTFDKNRAFLPCFTADDNYGIAMLDTYSIKVIKILHVTGAIYRIIGIKDDILIYIDNPARTGDKGMSLYFYDLREEKEVKTINIAQFLEANQ